jgi:hypothetical protein
MLCYVMSVCESMRMGKWERKEGGFKSGRPTPEMASGFGSGPTAERANV